MCDLTIQEIVDKFKQFDKNKIVRLQQTYRQDAGGDLVSFVLASFGEWQCLDNNSHRWLTSYVDERGCFFTEQNQKIKDNFYQCFESSYDWDLKSILIKLYQNIQKRKIKEN